MADTLEQQSWAGFAAGNADIWRELLAELIGKLYGVFMKTWPNRALAEELVQMTIFQAVKGLKSYDPAKGSPEKWIYGIARNNIRLEIRRRTARGSIDGDLSSYIEVIDSRPLPDEIIERQETTEVVREALNKLESKERRVLKLKYIDSLSAGEIGRQIGITEKAVHSLLYRARNSLRDQLKRSIPLSKEE